MARSQSHALGVASVYRHYASQAKDLAAQALAGTQPPQQPSQANPLQPQLRQQGMHPEQAEAEQTAVSDPAKEDADNWSAQLQAACHTITHDQVNNLDAAKEEMARALMNIRSTEQIFRGLKAQYDTGCTGMQYIAFSFSCLYGPAKHVPHASAAVVHYCVCIAYEPSVIMMPAMMLSV